MPIKVNFLDGIKSDFSRFGMNLNGSKTKHFLRH